MYVLLTVGNRTTRLDTTRLHKLYAPPDTHTHTHTPTHTHTHTPKHTHIYTHPNTHTPTHTYTHIYTHTYTHTHTHTHTLTHTRSVGILCTSDQHVTEPATYTTQTNIQDEYACPQLDSNPLSNNKAATDLSLRPHSHRNPLIVLC